MGGWFYSGLLEVGSTTSVASLFAGNVINLFLYGALTVQIYLYYTSFPQDPWLLKTTAYLIYATETVYTILLTYDLGNSMPLIQDDESTWNTWRISLIVIPIGGGIVAFLTQATYVYRLQILSKLKYTSWCIVALIVVNFVAIIVVTVTPLKPLAFVLAIVWALVSLVIDTIIASIMISFLTKSEIFSKQLKSKVIRLVHLIIGTGALTAAINLVTVILIFLGSTASYGPSIVLSKLYANSMMVLLNDRILYGHCCDDQVISEMMTGALGSICFAPIPGPAQEQLALDEGCDNARRSTLGRTAVEDPSKQYGRPV